MGEGFQYVVERKEQTRICFLSTQKRVTGFTKVGFGTDKFYTIKSSIDQVLNKVRSNRGVPGLANLTPRLPKDNLDQAPPSTRYNVIECKICPKTGYACLGGRGRRFKKYSTDIPGPGSYKPYKPESTYRMKKNYCFGGNITVVPAADIRCLMKPIDRCELCEEICTGDYWQRKCSFMCGSCMRKMWFKNYTKSLKEYKKVRECSTFHQHDGTPFAICLHTDSELRKRIAKECYLDRYFDPH